MTDRNIEAIHPLTALQEGILFHTLDDATPGVYFNQLSCALAGKIDEAMLQQSWRDAIERHAPLRTLFTWEKRSQPLQIVRRRVELPWRSLDWRDVPADVCERRLDEWLARDRDRGFALDRAPLIRLALIRLAEREWRLVWSFHHIILDGWSVRLIVDEVLTAYNARCRGDGGALPPAPGFDAFLQWLDARDDSGDEGFWRPRLTGFESPSTPDISLAGAERNHPGAPSIMTERTVPGPLSSRLSELARSGRCTIASVVAAAWTLVLARYCDTDDVVFGTTVAGRPPGLAGADRMAGLFINTLPLRIRIDGEESVADLCRRVMRTQSEQRDYEQTPLPSIRRWSDVDGPLFETILVFENLPEPDTDAADASALRVTDTRFIEYSNFPLALLAVPGDALKLIAVHQPARYTVEAISRLLGHVEHVLAQFAAGGERAVRDVALVTPSERAWLDRVATHPAPPPADDTATVIDRFERRVDAAPDAIAIVSGTESWTYAELEARANRIAAMLLGEDGADDPVVVYSGRTPDALATMLGALKAGRPYVPLEPSDAGGRLRQVVADLERTSGRAPAVLARASESERVAGCGARPLPIEGPETAAPAARPGRRIAADSIAYVIYTSGSTGEPKGVIVTHANLDSSTRARLTFYDRPPSTYALLSSLATDSAIAGIYWTLCSGGTLALPARRAELDVVALAALIERHAVSHLLCVPSLYSLLLEFADASQLRALDVAIVAGEACGASLVERHFAALPGTRLYNEYGPSEACVWASAAELKPADARTGVTIGRPIPGTRMYILDRERRPMPAGVAGELHIGGANVARGYLGRPALTRERFFPDPFAADGSRLYRTGDRARFRDDGRIEYLGRVDQQIKVRGFRVEPGEIEAVLAAHPAVDSAAAFLEAAPEHDGVSPPRKLIAAVTPAAGAAPDAADLRRHCKSRLPDYMLPQIIAIEGALPRTPAGKIDRGALARRRWSGSTSDAPVTAAPATPTERLLAGIWRDVLGVDSIGTRDNFFEIGGDSLLTIRILSRAAKAGLNLTPAAFFAEPTIAAQARAADAASPAAAERGPVTGPLPLMPIQHWFFDTIRTDAHQWNQSVLLELDAGATAAHVARAMQALLLQHDALRCRFPVADGQRAAEIVELADELPLLHVDARDASAAEVQHRVADIAARLNTDFDLAEAPLLRGAHVETGGGEPDLLLLVLHHLVVDAESWRLLIGDLGTLLTQLGAGGAPALPPKTSSVRTWATRLAEYAQSAAAQAHREYWRRALHERIPSLPDDVEQGAGRDTELDTQVVTVALDADATAALVSAVRGPGRISIFDMLATAFARALADWSDPSLVVFDTEGHGREPLFDDVDLSRTVGWFTSVYPIVLRISDANVWQSPAAAVRMVRDQLRDVPDRGIGYGILKALTRDPVVRAAPPAPVMFNFLGRTDPDDTGPVRIADERCGPARSPRCERAYALEVNARIDGGSLAMEWRFSGARHKPETIERVAGRCFEMLRRIVDDAAGAGESPLSAADFAGTDIDQAQLDTIAAQLSALDED